MGPLLRSGLSDRLNARIIVNGSELMTPVRWHVFLVRGIGPNRFAHDVLLRAVRYGRGYGYSRRRNDPWGWCGLRHRRPVR